MDFINKLENALEAYAYSTDVPISIINDLGNEVLQLGTTCSFCEFFKECTDEQCPCSQTHLYAGKQAERIGEAYIFSCPAGLIHYTVPLLKKGQLKGSVLAGPLLLDFVDDLIVDDIIQKFNLGVNMRGMVASKLRMIPVIEPLKVRHLSNLLFFVVTGLLEDEKHILLERNKKLFQQSQINESIQEVKNISNNAFYSYDSEKELLTKVKSGDVIGAKTIMNDLLGQIFFSSGGNMEMIKLRTLELCTLLSRATVEGGADFNKIFDLNSNFLSELSKIENLEELSYWLIKH